MKLLYDPTGNVVGAYAADGQALILPTPDGSGVFTLEDLPANLPLIADIVLRLDDVDSQGQRKYLVSQGALFVRQGWVPASAPTPPKYLPVAQKVTCSTARSLADILASLRTLTNTQLNAVWADLAAGTPPKYLSRVSPRAGAIFALDWAVGSSNAQSPAATDARLRIISLWVLDNPDYLVTPSFAPAVNVPGIAAT